ncbi:hypothetical protein CORC01_04232 [Colletotrichum orchidophilum]|uniref:Uncharacterized protein n=1 Tax=Colletotrichum orchidophilum TaxID=1209926 RepID=A0A1G4BGC0_9PEZI|nr:uncharacterized protein CORC01_04232 [Colletotrichum orchidophilum]OHF00482.1 hypothetical protein CORC01_04232 [Colletotrichum orchidophilum]
MMPSQRPFFLSTFFASFRQQSPSATALSSQQPNKHTTQTSSSSYATQSAASTPRAISSSASPSSGGNNVNANSTTRSASGVVNQYPLHSPRGGIPIPGSANRRRGSDSSSEGFRDVLGADKWYIGGRTAGGEEKFFKLGVVRRVRSNDGLSLDRLSL